MNDHPHISEQFDSELQVLQSNFAAMGGLVEAQVQDAMQAFKNVDLALAQSVRSREERVNEYEIEIHQETTTIIARRQPAASDLRLLIGMLKSSTDLERIGDEADRIAKIMTKGRPYAPTLDELLPIISEVAKLENLASQMLRESLNNFARKDEAGATKTIAADKEVDSVYRAIVESCRNGMANFPDHVDSYIAIIWVARSLERIGDHAKNIAENVVYSVRGEDIRHHGTATQ